MEETKGTGTKQTPRDDRKMDGWFSPAYTESHSVTIDPKKAAWHRCVCLTPGAAEIESYKMIRTQIMQATKIRGLNTIMVTSALPGEGKTLTAINLALTFAKEFDHTVLLIDCDLRQQMIHKYLGFVSGLGLADLFHNNHSLEDLIVWPGIEKLTIISGGRTILDSSELLESPKMKALVVEIKSRYNDRYVFFDVPPVLSSADALGFAPLVDGVIMVVESGKTAADDVKRAAALIPQEKFLGFILNRQTTRIKPGYGYA